MEAEGDIYGALRLRDRIALTPGLVADAAEVLGVRQIGDLIRFRPLPAPPEEFAARGRLHTRGRDARAVSSHDDVSNGFYRLILGPSMTYSCAVFAQESESLDDAQLNKYDLICRKLDLRPGMRLALLATLAELGCHE